MGKILLHDYFVVEIDQLYEKSETKSGIITLNDSWIEDGERFRFQYKRIYGTVLAVPKGYSDTPVFVKDSGAPNYFLYCGHDTIQEKVNAGYDYSNENYYPGLMNQNEPITLADYGARNTVKVGDRIYFNPVVTEQGNFLGGVSGRKSAQFSVRVDMIFCAVRDGKIIPQGGYVIVEPNMETWEDITTSGGIITKSKPEAKYLEGIVRHTDSELVQEGQYIYYITDADWPHVIEGKKMFVMREDEMLCAIEQ